ncbi:MAG: hypothetical protein LQ349_004533 [Xanthoria aureola]|nr:MAG: hypothetical protein LQ349_004533 [Xanthoria aureola]
MDRVGEAPKGGDENLGPTIIIINVIVFVASTLIVIVRTFTRLCLTKNFGWDDAVMVLTQVINACGMAFVGAEVSNGLGRKRFYLAPGSYKKFLKYDYLDWVQVFLTLLLSKISICLFLLRLSSFRKIRLGLHGMNIFLITSHIPLTFLMMFQCTPISKYWRNPLEGPGKCFDKDTVAIIIIVQGVFSIVSDFILAGFPILLLWNVQLSKRTKVGLCVLMGLGVITAGICIGRTALSGQVKTTDVSWAGVPNALARVFEINLGIIAACIPIMKPFVRYVKARATGQDPHDILYRTQTPRTQSMSHSHSTWYSRLRFGSRKFGSTSDKSGPWKNGPYHPSREPQSKNEVATQQSLALPLEGPRVDTYIEAGLAPVMHKESNRSMHSQLDPTFFVQDRV